jgi:peptidyl-prolyl cis-trans isomerase C
MSLRFFILRFALGLAATALILSGCRISQPAITPSPDGSTPSMETSSPPAPSQTPFEPSPTPPPVAALVNGEPILLSDYEAALARHASALGRELTPDEQQQTLDEMIDELLLVQAAHTAGYQLEQAFFHERLEQLTLEAGGEDALNKWMAENGYSEETFHAALRQAITAAWMRDQIIAEQPRSAEQVHARQIMVNSSDQANQILGRLQAGSSFTNIAVQVDPVTEGELGWFPRGYLLHPQLEEAAFALQAGEISGIIQTPVGYHILQVIEREPERALDPEPLRILQANQLQNWLVEQRQGSDIQVFMP